MPRAVSKRAMSWERAERVFAGVERIRGEGWRRRGCRSVAGRERVTDGRRRRGGGCRGVGGTDMGGVRWKMEGEVLVRFIVDSKGH